MKLINLTIGIVVAVYVFSFGAEKALAGTIGMSPMNTATTSCSSGRSCGLLGYWTFDGKDVVNGRVMDSMGGMASGTLSNISTSTFFAPGIIGQGFRFDGYDDFVDIDVTQSLTTFSLSFWWRNNFSQGSWPGNTAGMYFRADSFADASKTMRFYSTGGNSKIQMSSNNGGAANLTATYAEVQNGLYHNVINYTPTQMDWYVNGVLVSSVTPSAGTFDARRYLTIGGSRNAGQSVRGLIDDVRLYGRTLSSSEIQTAYNQRLSSQATSPKLMSTTTAQNSCTSNLACGLVGYWSFDGKDMNNGAARDLSGNGNTARLTSIATSSFYAPGKMGQGFNFDGVDDALDAGNGSGLSPTTAITMSAWIKPVSKGSGTYLNVLEKVSLGYLMYIRPDGIVLMYLSGVNNWVADITASGKNLFDGGWHHLLSTYDGTTQKLYVDNVLVTSTAATGSITPTGSSLTIGGASGTFYKGLMDDVRVYNRALSASEIAKLYTNGVTTLGISPQLTATTTAQSACSHNLSCGLVGYWTFDGKHMNNGTARDLSGNGNTVTLSNISTTTFYAPGRFGQGFNFDGTNDAANAGSGTTLDDLPAVTVSLWVKARSYGVGGGGYLVSKSTNASGGAGWFFRITQANSLISFGAIFNTSSLAVDSALNSFTTAADMNRWVHLVATWDRGLSATGVKIYKNGVEQTYSTQTNGVGTYNTDAALNLNIGDGGAISNRQSDAVIDEVRVYNRVLTATEVRRLYGQGK